MASVKQFQVTFDPRTRGGAVQVRGAYSIESNGQSRSSHARTASWRTGSSAAWSARTQDLTSACLAPAPLGVLAAWRVDVHAPDDVGGTRAEHGVGEPAAPGEVLCVPLQVAEVVIEGHLVRPAAPAESRCRPDVVDAGRPGGVIGLVVLRAERGQPEVPGLEPVRDREVSRYEQFIAHPAIVTPVAVGARPTDRAQGRDRRSLTHSVRPRRSSPERAGRPSASSQTPKHVPKVFKATAPDARRVQIWLASPGPAPQVAAHAVGEVVDLLLSSRQPGLGPRGARGGAALCPARLPASARSPRCPPE